MKILCCHRKDTIVHNFQICRTSGRAGKIDFKIPLYILDSNKHVKRTKSQDNKNCKCKHDNFSDVQTENIVYMSDVLYYISHKAKKEIGVCDRDIHLNESHISEKSLQLPKVRNRIIQKFKLTSVLIIIKFIPFLIT